MRAIQDGFVKGLLEKDPRGKPSLAVSHAQAKALRTERAGPGSLQVRTEHKRECSGKWKSGGARPWELKHQALPLYLGAPGTSSGKGIDQNCTPARAGRETERPAGPVSGEDSSVTNGGSARGEPSPDLC